MVGTFLLLASFLNSVVLPAPGGPISKINLLCRAPILSTSLSSSSITIVLGSVRTSLWIATVLLERSVPRRDEPPILLSRVRIPLSGNPEPALPIEKLFYGEFESPSLGNREPALPIEKLFYVGFECPSLGNPELALPIEKLFYVEFESPSLANLESNSG
jgi:hypothetical protein